MNNVNKTLYIPLFAKSFVSKKGLFIKDEYAEKIWDAEGLALRGRAKSKWLSYYLGIRARVFDDWVKERCLIDEDAAGIHIGCGLDSRALRVGVGNRWYDVDFPEVIAERRRYFEESGRYGMLEGDAASPVWLNDVAERSAIVVMEGVSMYIPEDALRGLFSALSERFERVYILMDAYSRFAARMSKYKNPIKEVGVTRTYGLDEPKRLEAGEISFLGQKDMTPEEHIDELSGMERRIFKKLYAGKTARGLYRIYEYEK